jgi:hypothetical protein
VGGSNTPTLDMLARDYSEIPPYSSDIQKCRTFPGTKDKGVKMTLISGVCCFEGEDDGQIAVADEQKVSIGNNPVEK